MRFYRLKHFVSVVVVLMVVVGVLLWLNRDKLSVMVPKGMTPSIGNNLDGNKLKLEMREENSPDGVSLKPVEGKLGGGTIKRVEDEKGRLYVVMVNLAELEGSRKYQVWLGKDSLEGWVSLGVLELSKGGWIGEFVSDLDEEEYKKVMVSVETKIDNKPEEAVLEGRFK